MKRSHFQFVLGLALGFLSIPAVGAGIGPLEANLVVGAAATMIAPRVWWAGMIAIFLGQSAAAFLWLTDGASALADRWTSAVQYSPTAAAPLLIGAVLGGVAWKVVERRHRTKAANECCDRLA
jgi:Na+/phosphate symporter